MTRITKMIEECFPAIMGINPVQGPFLLTTRAGRLSMEAQTKAIKHSPGRCSVLLSLLQALRVKTGVCACVHVCVCVAGVGGGSPVLGLASHLELGHFMLSPLLHHTLTL